MPAKFKTIETSRVNHVISKEKLPFYEWFLWIKNFQPLKETWKKTSTSRGILSQKLILLRQEVFSRTIQGKWTPCRSMTKMWCWNFYSQIILAQFIIFHKFLGSVSTARTTICSSGSNITKIKCYSYLIY